MEIEKFLNKKYKLGRCENLDEILTEMGKSVAVELCAKPIVMICDCRYQLGHASARENNKIHYAISQNQRRLVLVEHDHPFNNEVAKIQAGWGCNGSHDG